MSEKIRPCQLEFVRTKCCEVGVVLEVFELPKVRIREVFEVLEVYMCEVCKVQMLMVLEVQIR